MNEHTELNTVVNEVQKAIIGKNKIITVTMAAILAGGHILLEDIPGVGKTTLALAFSKAMGLDGKRMQFTPDVMPSDLTGFSVYNKADNALEYKAGSLMCNLFLGDEINRTSPKTQSALLEAMEEGRVSVDGITHRLPDPFIVIATQNPIGSAGTQELPDSQLDRFMVKLSLGYPDPESERIVLQNGGSNGLENVKPVLTSADLILLRQATAEIHVDDKILSYILNLATATRQHELIRLGLSPRGTLALTAMCRSLAMLSHRDYVVPEDVQTAFPPVAGHRLILEPRAKIEGKTATQLTAEILKTAGKVALS